MMTKPTPDVLYDRRFYFLKMDSDFTSIELLKATHSLLGGIMYSLFLALGSVDNMIFL